MNIHNDNAGGLHLFRRLLSRFLTEEEVIKIDHASVFLKFKKGETILKQGNKPTHIAFLQRGIVKFNYSETRDRNLILTLVKAPKILGGANLFYNDLNFFSIIALEESEVVLVDKDVLFELLCNNGKLAVGLFQTASEMFKQSILNFVSVASKQKESRIADVIIYLSKEIYNSETFTLSLTRKEIAEFACCSVENIIMTLSRWQQEGLLTISGKLISIKNMDKLCYISNIG